MDLNRDGRVTPDEIEGSRERLKAMGGNFDLNGDGNTTICGPQGRGANLAPAGTPEPSQNHYNMLLVGLLLGAMAVSQFLAWIYARRCLANGHSEIDKAHRETASKTTIMLVVITLMVWPGLSYKDTPVAGVYQMIAQNLKPRDSSGQGILAPQAYKNKSEQKESKELYGLLHRTTMAVILAMLSGLAAGALVKSQGSKMRGERAPYRPPSGPFQNH
ncbi:hypothetical protein IV102_16830 [bacterium]|nr:hypothetical protein [bacterium]